MNKYRYVEKEILCDYELDERLFSKLDLQVEDIIPLRKVFLLITNKGKKILKRCEMNIENVEFIDKALNYIYLKDKNVISYCRNKENKVVTSWNNKNYIVIDLIDGREATFTNPVEVICCSKSIAKLHEASVGIEDYINGLKIKCIYGENVIDKYINDLSDIKKLEALVKKFKYKNEFDSLFIKNIDEIKKQMDSSINLLIKSNYQKMKNDKELNYLCHNDLAHHNFIINNDEVNIIDFDYCNIDLRIIDIYIFISKVIKNMAYDKGYIDTIMKEYEKNSNCISIEEREVLKSLIAYPYDFVNIIKSYYFKEKSWEEEVFISRLKNKIEADSFRVELLKTL